MLLLLLGALGLWVSSRLTWATETVERPGAGVSTVDRAGTDLAPELVPIAVLCLAAIAAVVALSGRSRQLLGVVVLLAGAGAAALTIGGRGDLPPRALALVGAVLLVAAGVTLVVRGRAMPKLGGSYQTPGAAKRAADPDKELWHALERGDDPTDRD